MLVEKWRGYPGEGNPTVADAILGQLVSGAIRITLRGESMQRVRAQGDFGRVEDETNPALARSDG